MRDYGTVTPSIIKELISIAGPYNVISDAERLENYGHDETSIEEYAHLPEAAVTPVTTEQVADIMRLAANYRIPVTPRGAGSGLSGGAIPVLGGIVLSIEKMNKVIEIDAANLTVTAEAGIITNELNDKL
ncbi:MAG: FAD-binding oxidoreductase, partial [Spirochaetia bacterium]|nr:FAD-binding oxidoreductase [Spirochaetia bacterium]